MDLWSECPVRVCVSSYPQQVRQARSRRVDFGFGVSRPSAANLIANQPHGKLAETAFFLAPRAVETALDARPFQSNLAWPLAERVGVGAGVSPIAGLFQDHLAPLLARPRAGDVGRRGGEQK